MMNNLFKQISNVPAPHKEDVMWLNSSTATRDEVEIVTVKIAPSQMFTLFSEEYEATIQAYYTGLFAQNKPTILQNRHFTGDNATRKDGKEWTEARIIEAYAYTLLWATVAAHKRKYTKTADLKDLFNHIRTQRVHCPILLINTLNCIGPVDIGEKALRLEVEFTEKWNPEQHILTKSQLMAVSSWFELLSNHGFETVEYIRLGANGSKEFMMMTQEQTEAPSDEKNPFTSKFTVRSEKSVANIVGVYRYFIWTEDVKYLTSARRIFKYGTFDTNQSAMEMIVKTMLKLDIEENFNVGNDQGKDPIVESQAEVTEMVKSNQ